MGHFRLPITLLIHDVVSVTNDVLALLTLEHIAVPITTTEGRGTGKHAKGGIKYTDHQQSL